MPRNPSSALVSRSASAGLVAVEIVEIVAQALDAHLVEDAAGEDAALREIADVGQRGRARRVGDGRRNLVAVLRQQHLGKLAKSVSLLVAAAGVARRIGRRVGSGRLLLVGLAVLGR